ncbi:hypothetical protein FP744_10007526 [Trichoderma asperellum]|nr:hypothetical protein LI328DRAFT_39336 [Trichoderma asperelloides]
MFRAAAAGPFDEVVTKATDENLTSEDWGAIIEVCDKVSGDPNGAKEAVQSMIKRLAHRNANVQLYTLELAHALCQNCGKQMHREISSRAFTEALLKLANDRNTHQQVKSKILEKMQEWTDMFSSDADLGIMSDAFHRLKQTNPSLQPPSAPQKQGLTDQDRQKEDDELQIALKLSLQDEEQKKAAQAASSSHAGSGSQQQQQNAPTSTAVPSGTTAATVSRVRALFDFEPTEPGELEFKKGDVIAVLESVYKDWWRGSLKGKTGIFPLNYVEKLTDPTPEEMQREAQMEAEVFAEIKNVEKLLTLLSASNMGPREEDNEEISKLYHQTLAIRPKLIKLIEKYSQKKDDFTQLNEKFIKARRDYESLLETSMSHPPQHNYQQYAMRPGHQPYPPPAGTYPPQGQDPQRFYTPGSQGRPQYQQTSSPPPNFPQPGAPSQGSSHPAPAPFYVAGVETPAGQPPAGQQYPPRDNAPGIPPNASQPPPLKTTTSPPPQNFNPFQQPPNQQPPSTYGAQELATSVYDSPIAPNNPNSATTFASSVYSQDGPAVPHPNDNEPIAPYSTQQQPSYQSYQPPQQPPSQQPQNAMSPPPLQPSGPSYDSRQNLPSQSGAGSSGQYRPYVPPGSSEPSAPGPNDYYRQPGVY